MALERTKRIVTAAGIGLGALLLFEGGKRIQNQTLARLPRIDQFEDQLETLVSAAELENNIGSFAMRIDFGNRLLDYAVASRLRDHNSRHRMDITRAFEAYEVKLAVAYPLRDYDNLWLRRMDGGFSGRGLNFHIVGEDNLFVFDPPAYRPGNKVLV